MKKELKINIFDYTALQFMYLLMFLSVSKPFKTKIKCLTRFMEKEIYKGFSYEGRNILGEEFRVVYTLD